MKNHTRRYYEKLYLQGPGAKPPALTGKALAADLGYPPPLIDSIPDELWENFLPCGNLLPYVRPEEGDGVLNLGSGAGIDSLALRLTGGTRCRIVNMDIVFPVLEKASKAARTIIADRQLSWTCADGEEPPFVSGAFQWVILNGVLNLCADKEKLANGLGRILGAGGIAAGADLCRRAALPDYFRDEPDAWAWCMSGALSQEELEALFQCAGFERVELISERMDEFFDRTVFVYRKT